MILLRSSADLFYFLLAGQDPLGNWRRMGDGLRSPSTRVEFSSLLVYAVGAGLLGVLLWLGKRWRIRNDMNQRCNDPWKLFRALCQLHGLHGADRHLLKELVAVRELQQPAELFVTPAAFDPIDLPEIWNEQRLRKLKERLF